MSAQTATWAAYGLILLAGIVSQLAALRNPERASRIGRVVTWAMRRRATQLGLLLAWWWLGWHFITIG